MQTCKGMQGVRTCVCLLVFQSCCWRLHACAHACLSGTQHVCLQTQEIEQLKRAVREPRAFGVRSCFFPLHCCPPPAFSRNATAGSPCAFSSACKTINEDCARRRQSCNRTEEREREMGGRRRQGDRLWCSTAEAGGGSVWFHGVSPVVTAECTVYSV